MRINMDIIILLINHKNNIIFFLLNFKPIMALEIESIVDIEPRVENGELIFYFTGKNVEYTKLRMLNLIEQFDQCLESLKDDRISHCYFIFDLNPLQSITELYNIKELADVFYKHRPTIKQKVKFSVICWQSNYFMMFFNLFKQYYYASNPVYLTSTADEALDCIFNEKSRDKYTNLSEKLEN